MDGIVIDGVYGIQVLSLVESYAIFVVKYEPWCW